MIRHANLNDLSVLTMIESECFPASEAAKEKDFRARILAYGNHFYLLERDGSIVSFVNGFVTDEENLSDEMYSNVSLHNEAGAWQMVFGVNTLPEYRRNGYASACLNAMITDARIQGRKGLVLTCKSHMIHFYETFGFVLEGVSQSVHGNVQWFQMRLTF